MKSTLKLTVLFCSLFVIFLVMASGTRQGRQDYGLAQAFSLNGKYVFFYSRPYHPHDTVFKVTTLVMSNNADRGSALP